MTLQAGFRSVGGLHRRRVADREISGIFLISRRRRVISARPVAGFACPFENDIFDVFHRLRMKIFLKTSLILMAGDTSRGSDILHALGCAR
jgi:hypothetical protein